MKKLSQKITNIIKEERIRPISRSIFLIRNILLGLGAFVSLVMSVLSISLISYSLTSQDWDIYKYVGKSSWVYFLSIFPLLWIGFLVLFLLLAILDIEKTKNGYRYSLAKLIITVVFLVTVLGATAQAFGVGQRIDNWLGIRLTGYSTMEMKKEDAWTQPEKGLISGKIMSVEHGNFILKDFTDKTWNVDYSDAEIRTRVEISPESTVKIIGEVNNDNQIKATQIRPWGQDNSDSGLKHQRRGR